MTPRDLLRWLLAAALAIALLFLVVNVYSTGQVAWAMGLLVLSAAGFIVYLSKHGLAWRYLFPGVAGMLVFVAFPLLYTMQIGFTNYSSNNLLTLERARAYLLEQTQPEDGRTLGYTLHADGETVLAKGESNIRPHVLVKQKPDRGC